MLNDLTDDLLLDVGLYCDLLTLALVRAACRRLSAVLQPLFTISRLFGPPSKTERRPEIIADFSAQLAIASGRIRRLTLDKVTFQSATVLLDRICDTAHYSEVLI